MFLGYGRVSTAEQAADNATSLGEQERKTYAAAQLHGAGPYDFGFYSDGGVSGSVKLCERPEGQRLFFDMKEGDTIVATKMDRLFRSASDALVTAENLKNRGVDLILLDMGSTPVTSAGPAKMFFGMLALIAEFERERINERTNDGRKAKRRNSGHNGGPPPYGFQVIGEGRKALLQPCPREQEIVLQVKDLLKRYTPAAAAREAAQRGLCNRAGKPFQIAHLQRIAARPDAKVE